MKKSELRKLIREVINEQAPGEYTWGLINYGNEGVKCYACMSSLPINVQNVIQSQGVSGITITGIGLAGAGYSSATQSPSFFGDTLDNGCFLVVGLSRKILGVKLGLNPADNSGIMIGGSTTPLDCRKSGPTDSFGNTVSPIGG